MSGMARGLVVVARVVVGVLAYLAVLFATSIVVVLVGGRLVPVEGQAAVGLLGLGLAEGAALGAVLLVWRFLDRRPLAQLGLRTLDATNRWLRGAGAATLMMGFVVLAWYTLLDGAVWALNPDPARAGAALVIGLLGYAIQGPAEELLFRGYVFENVREQWGLPWAIATSSVSFALLHAPNPAFGVLPFINLVLFGVAMALYKARLDAGQLWGVFGIHTVWNWLQQVVFGLPNSGVPTVRENTLFLVTPNTSLPEPIWGGGFGPEGSLGATLVLLALIGVALRRPASPRASEQVWARR
jgi:membrane protease YdiL (CAAX protease family)